MAVTPLIKPIAVQGGSFFTFSSSSEDLGLTFQSSGSKFRFTKYVLLNIPNIATPAYRENKIQFGAIDGALLAGLDGDQNVDLAQSFQNYCLNLEAGLTSRPDYDRESKLNVTERVFWKWLKELGALRFVPANSMQSTTNLLTDPRWTEEHDVTTGQVRYDRVVKYIGDIDVVNSVQNNVNAYTEVYVHVPTNDGHTPLVMFKTLADGNYPQDFTLPHEPADPLNTETIFGRNYYDTHPAGLSLTAFFDQDTLNQPQSFFWNAGTSDYDIPQNWYDPKVGPNAYFTDTLFTDNTNDRIKKVYGLNEVIYTRSRLDGIMLDFDPNNYKPVADNPRISTLQEYNSTVDSENFEFNAVLLYYDIYDPNNPQDFATNLYGVLFLEDVEQISTEFGIPRFKKFKPNVVTKLNGNSYGFKINLKFDTSVDNAGVEKAINDFSSFSMDIFLDSMNIMQQSAQVLNDQVTAFAALEGRVDNLEDLIINLDTYEELDLRITGLEDSYQANQALFNNTNDIVGLINKTNDELNNIINNKTSIEVSYNLDAIKDGEGVSVDRSVPNLVRLSTTVQGYTIPQADPYQADISAGYTVNLQAYNNYFRHYASGLTILATGDIQFLINDTARKWKRGQSFRLAIEDVLDMGPYNLVVKTDAENRFGGGAYGMIVASLSGAEFDLAGDRPVWDIICVDEVNYTFVIDQVR